MEQVDSQKLVPLLLRSSLVSPLCSRTSLADDANATKQSHPQPILRQRSRSLRSRLTATNGPRPIHGRRMASLQILPLPLLGPPQIL